MVPPPPWWKLCTPEHTFPPVHVAMVIIGPATDGGANPSDPLGLEEIGMGEPEDSPFNSWVSFRLPALSSSSLLSLSYFSFLLLSSSLTLFCHPDGRSHSHNFSQKVVDIFASTNCCSNWQYKTCRSCALMFLVLSVGVGICPTPHEFVCLLRTGCHRLFWHCLLCISLGPLVDDSLY